MHVHTHTSTFTSHRYKNRNTKLVMVMMTMMPMVIMTMARVGIMCVRVDPCGVPASPCGILVGNMRRDEGFVLDPWLDFLAVHGLFVDVFFRKFLPTMPSEPRIPTTPQADSAWSAQAKAFNVGANRQPCDVHKDCSVTYIAHTRLKKTTKLVSSSKL